MAVYFVSKILFVEAISIVFKERHVDLFCLYFFGYIWTSHVYLNDSQVMFLSCSVLNILQYLRSESMSLLYLCQIRL